jgi:hypothetical protein
VADDGEASKVCRLICFHHTGSCFRRGCWT